MQRGRTLFWAITGGVVAAVAVVIALILVNSGTPPKAASSPKPSVSASASPRASESAPVVTPETSSTFSYLSDLNPSGNLGELVNKGPVKISGSIYPKSISFYCNVGDPTAFPAYKLKHNARRFQATLGLAAKLPPDFEAGIVLKGDGRTLRIFSIRGPKPKTIDVNVKGVRTLQLECFGSGSPTGGFAIPVAWGNARISGGH
jgi:hypothetical protein